MTWPTTWQGLSVLTLEPNRSGPVLEDFERRFQLLDPQTGVRTVDERAAAPAPVRSFLWTAFGRQEAAAMRSFLDARRGRLVPFWLPSWQRDLRLSADVILAQTVVSIVWIGYRAQMFGTTGARRHLASFALDRDATYHLVSAATDPGTGTTESLTLAPGAAAAWPASSTILSFLKLCRLEDDEVKITWPSPMVAQAAIRVRELPSEAPL